MQSVSFPQKIQISESHLNLVKNSVATGVAVCILINAEVALICMVANAALSLLAEEKDSIQSWFSWNDKTVEQLKEYWKNSFPWFKLRFLIGIIFHVFSLTKSSHYRQRIVTILIQSLQNPSYAIWLIFQICILTPLFEEVLYRGFIQEKLRTIQGCLFGKQAADSTVHKTTRIGLQALLFGWAHRDRPLILLESLVGIYAGYLKEKTSTLWAPIALHAHKNSSSAAAIVAEHLLA
ncbi:MAG TPA: CPBP family intramembrane glutamic endopeptidase [Rhabdochlamydiaceae bacterium]|nr:CPBP family intramembrane glutamic endopeptidase [Rhabdochlamydiaceae bacterium]